MKKIKLNNEGSMILPEHREKQWANPWEVERLASMHKNITDDMVVYDIGAEEGDISGIIATWAGEFGEVHLFEPSPYYWPAIKAIFEANNLKLGGYFVGFASDTLKDDPELQDFSAKDVGGWPECAYGDIMPDFGFRHLNEQTDSTPQITLDKYAGTHKIPNVITMDVEGAEIQVLKGAKSILEHYKPLVYVSIHPDSLRDRYDSSPEDILEYMADFGYLAQHLATDHEEHWVFWHMSKEKPL